MGKEEELEAQNESEPTADAMEQLFSDNVVNLDVFTAPARVLAFKMSDVEDQPHEFLIPKDIPFAHSIRFMHAHDRFERAAKKLNTAKNQQDSDRWLEATQQAWDQVLDALLEVVRIKQPEVQREVFDRFGQNVMENWANVLITRLQLERLRYFGGLDETPDESEKPSGKRQSKKGAKRRKS